ncbi:MAG: NAD(P)-dependent oxidoreductase [Proteobacteria bacterium]|nr:NAD(P)-dependent oxidoreductase [Pseudomonadota bacterium]
MNDQRTLRGKTLFITGASRGIGLSIALRAARDGANIVIAAKSAEPHPKLPGTIHTAAAAIEAAGGQALPLAVDIRHEDQVQAAVDQAVARFGGIDICVNNASAISKTGTLETDMKRFDLLHGINTRGTYLVTRICLPHLLKANNPHVLMLSPPLNMEERWFKPNVAYTIAKFGMSMCVLGMAGEFHDRVAFNALWPRTFIGTAAVQNILGGATTMKRTRRPDIVADAAHAVLTRDRSFSGNFCIDEQVLRAQNITDLSVYSDCPESDLIPDAFI